MNYIYSVENITFIPVERVWYLVSLNGFFFLASLPFRKVSRNNYEFRILHIHTQRLYTHACTHHPLSIIFGKTMWRLSTLLCHLHLSLSLLPPFLPPCPSYRFNLKPIPYAGSIFVSLNHLETAAEGREYVSLRFLKMRLLRVGESAGNKIFFNVSKIFHKRQLVPCFCAVLVEPE